MTQTQKSIWEQTAPRQLECIYNIGVLIVNIEFMWRALETGNKDEI